MPTPFTHLARAQQLLDEHCLPDQIEAFLRQYWDAFLFGSIAPDAHHRVNSETVNRVTTHFFDYGPVVDPPAVSMMLNHYPSLLYSNLGNTAHAAFVAGYVGHLAMDEIWAVDVVHRFAVGDWSDRKQRHFAFTSLIALMDARDYELLPDDYHQQLGRAVPDNWLDFLPDEALVGWQSRIVEQIEPGGKPDTLPILARTIYSGYGDLVEMLQSPQRLQNELWAHFSETQAAAGEAAAYANMQHAIIDYLQPNERG